MRHAGPNSAIAEIAAQLGLVTRGDSAAAIVEWCQAKTAAFMTEYGGCGDCDELLALCAQKTGTRFEVIDTLEALDALVRTFLAHGENQFATLESEFERGVLGVTFRLRRPNPWDCPFVSVIDARGERRHRAWFTRWHELGHLLTLATSSRPSFCRTHVPELMRDPEELLVDRIAGACAFHPELVKPLADSALTFHKLESVRTRLCPQASIQSAQIGLVQAWPSACLLLDCCWASRRGDLREKEQLRAVKVIANHAARQARLRIHPNMRVPEQSIIHKSCATAGIMDRVEDLSWWSSSSGAVLPRRRVLVSSKKAGDVVQALVCIDASKQEDN
jgi:hypothetical protein